MYECDHFSFKSNSTENAELHKNDVLLQVFIDISYD